MAASTALPPVVEDRGFVAGTARWPAISCHQTLISLGVIFALLVAAFIGSNWYSRTHPLEEEPHPAH